MAKREFIGMTDQPFSSAVRAGDFIFTSGRSGYVDARGNPVKCIQAQTRQRLGNLKKQLGTGGSISKRRGKGTGLLTYLGLKTGR